MQIHKLISHKIATAEKILLLTHENPDGDAIGSAMALFNYLRQIGKYVDASCPSDIPDLFKFLPLSDKFKKDFLLGDYDLVIILDCGDLKRTGFAHRLKELNNQKKRIINIDHHSKNDLHNLAQVNYIDYQASSTAELVYKLLQDSDCLINKEIATCLLCGIYTDTGSFKHSNTSEEVLKISAHLLRCGARLNLITSFITNGKSVPALKLWGIALSRIRENKKIGLISSIITQKDIQSCQATNADLAGVVNLINTIPQTRAAILFSEIESGKIKASIRTERNDIDVSHLAAIFGGGGLKKASGFSIDGQIIAKAKGDWEIKFL